MKDAIRAQISVMPDVLEAERKYLPQWQKLQEDKFRAQAGTMLGIYDEMIPASQKLGERQLAAARPVLGEAAETMQGIYRRGLGSAASGLLTSLQKSAATDLAAGRGLTEEETLLGQQAARGAMQARGLQGGNQAVAAEVLGNYNLSTQRENQRRGFAQGVYGLSEASQGNAYNLYGQPLMGVIGATMPSALLNASGAMLQGLGPQLFQQESSYNSALITANRKEQMDAQIANAQASAARTGAIIGAVGTIAGAGLGGWAAGLSGAGGAAGGVTNNVSLF